MQMYKRNKGITLVALIITIIILLILAGVSLSFVFNGGILDKAQSAVNEYENASKKEQDLLDQIDKYIENELGDIAKDESEIPRVDENGLATENTTIVAKDDPSIQIVIPKGFAPVILQTGTTQSLPGENGAVKNIMPAEVSTLNRWYEDKNTEEYLNMVSSVNKNKGFYISRYEASQKDDVTAQSKRKQNPWIEVLQTIAVTASINMNTSINSHLIYAIEWDSILQWLLDSEAKIGAETSGTDPKKITLSDIQSDSRSWGNYNNSIGGAEANSGNRCRTRRNK